MMVVAAMFNKASRVKKAWRPVMITFGNVSSCANTSSLRINPERAEYRNFHRFISARQAL